MKRVIKFLILGVIAVVFIGTIGFFTASRRKPPPSIQVDSPVKMSIVKKTVATGKVIPRREIEVKSQVSGVVEKLYVAAGQAVKKGAISRASRCGRACSTSARPRRRCCRQESTCATRRQI